MEYKLTYMNGGKDKSIRSANFDSDTDALRYAETYNSINDTGRIQRITKIIAELPAKEEAQFLNQNFNIKECCDLTIPYRTTKGKLFNIVIPFMDKRVTKNQLKNLMYNVNNFKEIAGDIMYKISRVF